MQQQIASIREEVNKKEQALRSITGKVSTKDTNYCRAMITRFVYLYTKSQHHRCDNSVMMLVICH